MPNLKGFADTDTSRAALAVAAAAVDVEGDSLETALQVRAAFGGVSDMTLWRWLADPELGFPKPIVVRRRRYWRRSERIAFMQRILDQGQRTEAA